jgi:hypothetical protein
MNTNKIATKFSSYFGPMGSGAMRLVIVESPCRGTSRYKGIKRLQHWLNLRFARRCLQDCLSRGEAPIASHLLYTQVLDDGDPKQRQDAIEAGLAWMRVADACVVYADRGISEGMRKGIEAARFAGIATEIRRLRG